MTITVDSVLQKGNMPSPKGGHLPRQSTTRYAALVHTHPTHLRFICDASAISGLPG